MQCFFATKEKNCKKITVVIRCSNLDTSHKNYKIDKISEDNMFSPIQAKSNQYRGLT